MSDNPPIHGTPDGAAWFRAKLEELGESQRGLAKILKRYGDDRQFETIVRHLSRIATGQARVPGEMRALLNMMQRGKERSAAKREAAERLEAARSHKSLVDPDSLIGDAAAEMGWLDDDGPIFAVPTDPAASRGNGGSYSGRATVEADLTLSPEEAERQGIRPGASLTVEVSKNGKSTRWTGVAPEFLPDGSVRLRAGRHDA
jgi:hypothetical protein